MMKISILNPIKKPNVRGDTIVEVLLSVTIISFVLGAAYLLTSRSLQAAIAAREHTEALNYVQGQIERLKSAKESTSKTDFDSTYRLLPSAAFCLNIDPASNTVSKKDATLPACYMGPIGPNGLGRYHLSAIYTRPTDTNPNTFKFSVTWERTGTSTPESADIYYRPAL